MIKKVKLLTLVTILGGVLFGGLRALAVNTSDMDYMMTISPPRQRIVLVPGEVYSGSINVSNMANAKRDVKYSVSIGSFNLGEDENGNIDYNSTDVNTITGYNQIMDWIVLEKESGTVAPGTTDAVSYTITVPEDAPAGGQYASILFRDDTGEDSQTGENVIIENVVEFAATIIAEVAGETRDEGAIVENGIPSFILSNVLTAESTVRNNGNVHTDASYVLQVWPLFSDEEICTNEENVTTSLIMPETERYHAESCTLPAVGVFRAKQIVSIFGETSIVEKTVIVCPLWLLFIIILVIVVAIIYFVSKSRPRKTESSRAEA